MGKRREEERERGGGGEQEQIGDRRREGKGERKQSVMSVSFASLS